MRRVAFIAAGGTGGHIYPALAIAQSLRELHPELDVQFVGTALGLENQIVPRAQFVLHHLSIGPLHSSVGLIRRLKTLALLPIAALQSFWLVVRYQPRFVLGVGGYASGPLVLLAALMRRPAFIWEPNAVPGLANRWLSPFVKKSFVVFEEARRRLSSSVQSGMPLRSEIEQLFNRQRREVQLPLRLFVFGGSQGARAINEVVTQWLCHNPELLQSIEVVHQTGSRDFQRVTKIYNEHQLLNHPRVQVLEFVHDMHEKYMWADLAICRSGAGTLAELAASGCPSILVPFPFAADDHQTKNAESYHKAGAAWVIIQSEFDSNRLNYLVQNLIDQPGELTAKSKALKSLFQPRAADAIVKDILENSN